MSAFFELRIYQIFPGKMDEVDFIHGKNNNAISSCSRHGYSWQFYYG
jgi:hypothetical protein